MHIHGKQRGARLALLVGGLALCAAPIRAGFPVPPPVLNPKNYFSPSRRYSLFVDPSDLHGRGKASYRLTLDGKEIWCGEKPYTVWDACVADDGLVAGYAYSHGPRGDWKAGKRVVGDFRVVIIDRYGKERLSEAAKREPSNFPEGPPNPVAAGLIVDAANDRMVVRIYDADVNRNAENWRTFQLSTGKPLATFRPKALMPGAAAARHLWHAKPVVGTPLFLLHWWRYDSVEEPRDGARFALIGEDGREVWSLDLPGDYEVAGDEKAEERLIASLRRTGGILRCDQPGRFEVRFAKDAQRVTFSIARAVSEAWTVSEVERRPFIETTTPAPKPAEIPRISLRPAGCVVLNCPHSGPEPEIRGVGDFVIDPRGRIAFLRSSEGKSLALTVLDQDGTIIHKVPLECLNPEKWGERPSLSCVGLRKYLLIHDDPDNQHGMAAAIVDVETGKATSIPGFTTTALSKVAGFPDGGFAVLGGLVYFRGGATGDGSLHTFDEGGTRLWFLPGSGDWKDPAALFSPDDLTVTTERMIAVIDETRKIVQFFDRSGKHHHTVDLQEAWGREPYYPKGISADRDGGIVVHDFQGDPPIVRMRADGKVRAEVRPRLKDGRRFHLSDAQVAPGGTLWVSDGHAVYRLGESGEVDRVLGEAPNPFRLDRAAAVTLDGRGRIYAAACRTGAVHVFGLDGNWVRVCVPGARDVTDELSLPHLTVSDSGDVYLSLDGLGDHRLLHFAADGKRVGIEASKLNVTGEKCYAQRGSQRRWVLGYEMLYLTDRTGAVIRTIARRADGLWLEYPQNASVAPDGSIAVVSRGTIGPDQSAVAVNIYSPEGEPIRTFPLPRIVDWFSPEIAYDGKRVVIAEAKAIVLFEASGKAVGQFTPPADPATSWTPFLAADGAGLLLFDGLKTLHRFEPP